MSALAVAVGAALGALLRWQFGLLLNQIHPHWPMGTLVANLGGGFLAGLAVAFFGQHASLAPEWRLLAITGFLGGLTTFSTFSAEAVALLQRGDYGWALGHSALHLGGSILCCIAGMALYRAAL
ncbi:MAG: camphor resistance CrcB protein [Pseudomonadota bacterium]|jgi:CrcB protein